MRKYIVALVIVVLTGAAVYHIYFDKSYQYYDQAKVLYDQGKYREAYQTIDQGLKINMLNRKLLDLKGKVYPIVEGQADYKEASKLYEDAINLAMNGQVDAAKIKLSKAYDLAFRVGSASGVRDQAQELIRKIERDATLVLDSAQETMYKNALKLEGEGNLLRAYEALSNISVKSEKIKRKMSDIAFRIGERSYMKIKQEKLPSDYVVKDAEYWYSQVQPFDDNYMNANNRINELRLMKTK